VPKSAVRYREKRSWTRSTSVTSECVSRRRKREGVRSERGGVGKKRFFKRPSRLRATSATSATSSKTGEVKAASKWLSPAHTTTRTRASEPRPEEDEDGPDDAGIRVSAGGCVRAACGCAEEFAETFHCFIIGNGDFKLAN
jgi:hypothetical protein